MKTILLLIALAAGSWAQTPLCGRESTIGSLRVLVLCPDWAVWRAATGSDLFPDAKGQQVFVRTTNPTTTAFRITMRYLKDGEERSIEGYSRVNQDMDSGVGWVLGDIKIISVSVEEIPTLPVVVIN